MLAPHLDGALLHQALEAGLAFAGEDERARVLAALAPRLDGEARMDALTQGLAAALAIADTTKQAKALTTFVPYLDGEKQADALQQGLAAALAIKERKERQETFAALANDIEGEQWVNALYQVLNAALAIKDEELRAHVFGDLYHSFPDTSVQLTFLVTYVQTSIADTLRLLRTATGEEVLHFCGDQKLFAPPIFSKETLAAIARHIIEVCNEWTWL